MNLHLAVKNILSKVYKLGIKKSLRYCALKVDLGVTRAGLCNKLHNLFSACDIALKQGLFIVEPEFGWKYKIRFSDIFDLHNFNLVMSKYNNGKCLIVDNSQVSEKDSISLKDLNIKNNLWNYSEKELSKERRTGVIRAESTKFKVLEALKLKPEYENIVKNYVSDGLDVAIQVRTESDWKKYAENKKISDSKESVYVSLDKLVSMVSSVCKPGNAFFTSGENHQEIVNTFSNHKFNVSYFFDPGLEYEINAAINFEICAQADMFIGNSRSSYSNLISLKRAFHLKNDNSFIYNYGDRIHRRVDKGIQPAAYLSISKKTEIINGLCDSWQLQNLG
ncbi:MAG: hypothetical protein GX640_08530 [Fibrobacter sp.]|nr:hypothetical protein [Fibrobacter sp.]